MGNQKQNQKQSQGNNASKSAYKSTYVEMPLEDLQAVYKTRAEREGGRQVLQSTGKPLVGATYTNKAPTSHTQRVYAGKISICRMACCTHPVPLSNLTFYQANNYVTDDNKPSREEKGGWIHVGKRRHRPRLQREEADYDARSVNSEFSSGLDRAYGRD